MKINFHGLINKSAIIEYDTITRKYVANAKLTNDEYGADIVEFKNLLDYCPPKHDKDSIKITIEEPDPAIVPAELIAKTYKTICVNDSLIPLERNFTPLFDDIKKFLNKLVDNNSPNVVEKPYWVLDDAPKNYQTYWISGTNQKKSDVDPEIYLTFSPTYVQVHAKEMSKKLNDVMSYHLKN